MSKKGVYKRPKLAEFGPIIAIISHIVKIIWYLVHLTFLTYQYTTVNDNLISIVYIWNHIVTYIGAWNDNFKPPKKQVFPCFERIFDQNIFISYNYAWFLTNRQMMVCWYLPITYSQTMHWLIFGCEHPVYFFPRLNLRGRWISEKGYHKTKCTAMLLSGSDAGSWKPKIIGDFFLKSPQTTITHTPYPLSTPEDKLKNAPKI